VPNRQLSGWSEAKLAMVRTDSHLRAGVLAERNQGALERLTGERRPTTPS